DALPIWIARFARFEPFEGSLPEPLALRYHGHQFRAYNPDLGDGRGFLLAQLRDGVDGRLLDLGTKGSGTTPYSRGGDGRLTLKGGVREILATEMLEALGVPTSKSFSLYELADAADPYRALYGAIARRTVALTARWMVAGFVHGVLNTDNMNVTGESFDYGPWRFLPRYDPMLTAAYFDHSGLYAFGRQPEAA